MTDFIAETVVDALDAKGRRLRFHFGIEAQMQIDDVSWGAVSSWRACQVGRIIVLSG